MDMNMQLGQYQQDAINTATPEQLTLMLYRAALKGIRTIRAGLNENPENALTDSQLSRDILAALADNVNMDHPYGQQMRDLYLYCWRTVLAAAIARTPDNLDAVEAVLQRLIDGLEGFREKSRQQISLGATQEILSINFAG